jgi:hypothetical protein
MKRKIILVFLGLIFLGTLNGYASDQKAKKKIIILGFQSGEDEYSGVRLSQKLGEILFSQNKFEISTPPMSKEGLNFLKGEWPGYNDWEKIKRATEKLNGDLVFWGKILKSNWGLTKGIFPPYPFYRFCPQFEFSVQMFLYEPSSQRVLLYKNLDVKEKGGKRISLFSFSADDPDLFPSAKEKDDLKTKTLDKLANEIASEIEKSLK